MDHSAHSPHPIEMHAEASAFPPENRFACYYVVADSVKPSTASQVKDFPKTTVALKQVWDLVSDKFKAEIIGQYISADGHFILKLRQPLQIWKPSSKRQDGDHPSNWIFVHAGNKRNEIRGVIEGKKIRFTEGFSVKFGILPAINTEVTLESTGESSIKATAFKISKTYQLDKIKNKVGQCKCSEIKS